MAQYEMAREIKNMCRNNQMRDVFFEDVETDDPEQYVRDLLQGRSVDITVERMDSGAVTVHATCDGLIQKFLFSPL